MLYPGSRPPRAVEAFLNSGQPDERRLTARVLGVDRGADLAVLDVGPAAGLPPPLVVASADGLRELHHVYVFGFPLGERLGKEITVRPASVSSLRKKDGVLDKIQVDGGMDPGNSGGPVVDGRGRVVGVAVSGIPGRAINFAIPADHVHAALNGRLADLDTGVPFVAGGGRVGVPVTVELVDPLRRVREVFLDVWTGEARRPRPPGAAGDSPRQRHKLVCRPGAAAGEVVLPALPPGKVYWVQPGWVRASGKTCLAAAEVYRPSSQPVERRPAALVARFRPGAARDLTLTVTHLARVTGGDEGQVGGRKTRAVFREQVAAAPGPGGRLTLSYRSAADEEFDGHKPQPSALLGQVRPFLGRLVTVMHLDAAGNPTAAAVSPGGLAGLPAATTQDLLRFHAPLKDSLRAVAVPLPNKEVAPGEQWRADRPLPTLMQGSAPGRVALTYTYLGRRRRGGRDEAVLAVSGVARGGPGQVLEPLGPAGGTAVVDLATGEVRTAEVRLLVEAEVTAPGAAAGAPRRLRALNALHVRLERGP
jgi:hypothetical protein